MCLIKQTVDWLPKICHVNMVFCSPACGFKLGNGVFYHDVGKSCGMAGYPLVMANIAMV